MKILVNFVPLKTGGGVQVGLDFVEQARKLGRNHEWFIVATQGTPLAVIGEDLHIKVIYQVRRSLLSRLWFEYIGCRRVIARVGADLIYTQFGPHWPGAKIRQIVGCAYSNILYPEVDFWAKYPFAKRLYRKLVDHLRKRRLSGADLVIFETEDLAQRALSVLRLPKDRIAVVKPSVSQLVKPGARHAEMEARCKTVPNGFRVLLLSVFNPNKNIDLLPIVARILRSNFNVDDVVFVITLRRDEKETMTIIEQAHRLGVESRLFNIGPVPHDGCAELYRACDAVILPSQLESFSNTIAEAWTMQRPLLISDLDWARTACGDGAVYFKYADPIDIAGAIVRVKNDASLRRQVIENGLKMLKSYPTSEQRFLQYLDFIEQNGTRQQERACC